jgi:NADH:ubiquinone oxidoreductase subunit E
MRGLIFLMCLPAAVAQPGADPWSGLRAKNPSGVEFSLRLLREGSYREGELIRAEVHYPGLSAPAQRPPAAMWQSNGFLLDPAAACGTLASPCFPSVSGGIVVGTGSGPQSDAPLLSLNNYFPSLRPGRYRAAALRRKTVLTNRGAMSSSYGYADPAQYAVSNTIEFEVIAASPEWITQAIAASVANLKGREPNSREAYEARKAAAEQLRFLDTPAAWRAALDLMPAEENVLLEGLSASSQPARVCELMLSAIPAPGQAVSSYYLDNLSRICATANLPAPPPNPPLPPPGAKPAEPTAEQTRYWQQWSEYRQSVVAKASAALAASVPAKIGEKKAIAFDTLMERVQQAQPLPEWVPALKSEFIKSYATIEGRWQRQLLSFYANRLRSRDLIPLLESVLDGWKPGDYYEAPREALASLYEIDTARAQARIVAEVKKDRTWLDASQLALLPPGAARITDDELIEALADAQRAGGWNVPLRMTALAKYGTPKALPRVKAIFESQQESCQPELMAYFVRVDPAYADRVFHSHPWDMQAEPPRCTAVYFARTPRIAMGPVLEKYMAAYLMHRTVYLKKTAAQSLGRFGSPAALGPLWDAFRYFHDYWKGKPAELAQNGEGVGLEMELRNAIARGKHWLATDTDLRTIESLCVSERCLAETQQDLRAWQKPLRIELRGQTNATVAQYYEFESLHDIEEKLGQFPKGTQFVLTAAGSVNEAAAEIRKYAAGRGLAIVPR